jgi:hypothetical protein
MSTNAGFKPKRRIHPGVFAAMVVLVFAGTIGVGAALGTWQVDGRGSGAGSGDGTGDGAGRVVAPQDLNTSEIKGWMAIGDVAAAWSIPLPEVLANFNLPADTPPSTALKDLESDVFSVSDLRDWLASRTAGEASEGP